MKSFHAFKDATAVPNKDVGFNERKGDRTRVGAVRKSSNLIELKDRAHREVAWS